MGHVCISSLFAAIGFVLILEMRSLKAMHGRRPRRDLWTLLGSEVFIGIFSCSVNFLLVASQLNDFPL